MRRWSHRGASRQIVEAQHFFLSGVYAEESLWGFGFKLLVRGIWPSESQSSK